MLNVISPFRNKVIGHYLDMSQVGMVKSPREYPDVECLHLIISGYERYKTKSLEQWISAMQMQREAELLAPTPRFFALSFTLKSRYVA